MRKSIVFNDKERMLELLAKSRPFIHGKDVLSMILDHGDNSLESLEILFNHGFSVATPVFNGMTMLYMLSFSADDRHIGCYHFLLRHGADPNERDRMLISALMGACSVGSLAKAKLLLEYGADKNSKSKSGMTAMAIAIMQDHGHIVELLKSH